MDPVQTIIKRTNSLRLSGVYMGTLCEFKLDNREEYELIFSGFKVIKRDCAVYPFYITWVS